MRFSKGLSLILAVVIGVWPVMVSGAELSGTELSERGSAETETARISLVEEAESARTSLVEEAEPAGAEPVEDELTESEFTEDTDRAGAYHIHKAAWEKTLEDVTSVLGDTVKLSVKISDTVSPSTVSDPDAYIPADGEYLSQAETGEYGYSWTVKDEGGQTVLSLDTVKDKVTETVEFTPAKAGKYSVLVVAAPVSVYQKGFELSSTATLTVTEKEPVKVSKITLKPSLIVGKKGGKYTIKAIIRPKNAANKGIRWTSSNEKIAKVDANGKVKITGKKGKATITATATDGSNVSAKCSVRVGVPVKKIRIDAPQTTVKVGSEIELRAFVTPHNATKRSVAWKSSDESIATVSKKGVVKGIKPGKVKITATAKDGSGVKKSVEIKVEKKKIKVKKITLNKTGKTLKPGDTFTFEVKVSPKNATNSKVVWTSGDPKIAKVNKKGMVTALRGGTVRITATAKDGSKVSASALVRVASMKLETKKLELKPDRTKFVRVKSEFDRVVSFAVKGDSVYVVYDAGKERLKIKGLKVGTSVITVMSNTGIRRKLEVTVKDPSKK